MKQNKNWSKKVSKNSFALDLEEGVFTWVDPKQKEILEKAKIELRQLFRSG